LGVSAYALTPGASGKICGAKCKTLTPALAKSLAQRNGAFSTTNAPKPAPYYRIVIKGHREGFISRTIIWVPSRKLWFDKQYVTPPIAGYWRTDQPSLRSKLKAFVRNLKPHPAPAKWSTVLPK
jgi:hypothetical protein